MKAFACLLAITTVYSVVLNLCTAEQKETSNGAHVTITQIGNFSPLRKYLSSLLHVGHHKKHGKGPTLMDDYDESLELWNLEFPLLFLQLRKWGDNILLPSTTREFSLFGKHDIDYYRNPVLKNASQTNLRASMNGTRFRVDFEIPNLQVHCPECIFEHRDDGGDTAATRDLFHRKFYTMFIRNYTLSMSCKVEMGKNGLEISNLDIYFNIGEIRHRYENGTHILPGGREELLGPLEQLDHPEILERWYAKEDKVEKNVERVLMMLLNCFMKNNKYEETECDHFFEERLYRQSIAEIFHALGLSAVNKQRTTRHVSTYDPITTINSILFDFGTHVLQTGKLAASFQNWEYSNKILPITFPWWYNYTKEVCLENNQTVCETFREEVTLSQLDIDKGAKNNPWPYATVLYGASDNNAEVFFDKNTVNYTLLVPCLILNSTDYRNSTTNLKTNEQLVYSELELSVLNSFMGVSADFDFNTTAGHFSVSNVKVALHVGQATMKIPKVSKFENGSWTELPPVEENAAEMVNQLWASTDDNGVTLEKRYSAYVEESVNDFLAGRSSL